MTALTLPSYTFWDKQVIRVFEGCRHGILTLRFANGQHYRVQGDNSIPPVTLTLYNNELGKYLAKRGKLGFCEAYKDGHWSTPDLTALMFYIFTNMDALDKPAATPLAQQAMELLKYWQRRNNKNGSRRNIHDHYDIGNAFYELWLDKTMTYSSAWFSDDTQSHEEAQLAKYKRIYDSLNASKGQHILEIGCGWGGFAEYAAQQGCRVTGVTLSTEQQTYAQERLHKQGLSELTDIRLQDYRDITGQYDHIVSIEMIEAVGEAYWPTYFNTIKQRLREGGRALIQAITIEDSLFASYRRDMDFIRKYIFPGGMLLCNDALAEQGRKAGLTLMENVGFGLSYARSLRLWNEAFQAQWPQISQLGFDSHFKRLWEMYLCLCEACFAAQRIDVRHALYAHR